MAPLLIFICCLTFCIDASCRGERIYIAFEEESQIGRGCALVAVISRSDIFENLSVRALLTVTKLSDVEAPIAENWHRQAARPPHNRNYGAGHLTGAEYVICD